MLLEVKSWKVNDSTACLFTGISEHPSTRIGIIIGSGFNISFLNSDNDDVFADETDFQIINTELGRDPRTKNPLGYYARLVDDKSPTKIIARSMDPLFEEVSERKMNSTKS